MAEIASLLVRIGADANGLVAEFARAGKELDKAKDGFERVTKAAAGFVATAATVATTIAVAVRLATEHADAMFKGAQMAGMATAAFSEYDHVAKLSNLSTEDLTASIAKLNKNIAEAATTATAAAGDAFRALHVEVKNLDGSVKSADELLLELADKFAGLEDGPRKSALAIAIFGKSGEHMLPMLNSGAAGIKELREEARQLGVSMDTETGKAAEKFNDDLTRLAQAGRGLTNQLMRELLPAMNLIADGFVKAAKESGGVQSEIAALADFLQSAGLTVFQTLAVVGSDVAFVFKMIAGEITTWGAQLTALATLDFKGFRLLGDQWKDEAAQARKDLDSFQSRILGIKKITPVAPGGAMDMGIGVDLVFNKKKAAPEIVDSAKLKEETDRRNKEVMEARKKAGEDEERIFFEQQKRDNEMREKGEQAANDASIALSVSLIAKQEELQQAAFERKKLVKGLEYKTDEELEIEAFEKKMAQLSIFTDEELELVGGRHFQEQQMEQDHQEKLRDIRGRGLRTLTDFTRAGFQQQAKTVFEELANITAGVAQHNRALFEINKVAGIANAIIHAYEGISLTMAKYPYPLNIAMAAAHGLAAFAQVQAIRSAQFGDGGGGAAPSLAGGTAAPPVTPVDAGGRASSGRGPTTIIQLHGGEVFSRDQVRGLIEQIAEDTRDGGTVRLAN